MTELFKDHMAIEWNNPHKGRRTFELTIGSHKYHVDDILADTPESPLLEHLGRIFKVLRAAEELLLKPISNESLSKLESSLMAIDSVSRGVSNPIDLSSIDSAVAIAEQMEAKINTETEEALRIKAEADKRDQVDFDESQQARKTRAVLEVVECVIRATAGTKKDSYYILPEGLLNELEVRYSKLIRPCRLKAAQNKVDEARSEIKDQIVFMERHPSKTGGQNRNLGLLYKNLANLMDELSDLEAQSASE